MKLTKRTGPQTDVEKRTKLESNVFRLILQRKREEKEISGKGGATNEPLKTRHPRAEPFRLLFHGSFVPRIR